MEFCIPSGKIDPQRVNMEFENLILQTHDLKATSDAALSQFKSNLVDISHKMANNRRIPHVLSKSHDSLK
jgi:hypothetical protein